MMTLVPYYICSRKRWIARIACSLAALSIAAGAQAQSAQSYPVKPVRFVYPYALGAAGGNLARTIAQALTNRLGQNVYVESLPGANGSIGTSTVVRAPADGYTLLFGTGANIVFNKLLRKNLGYDTERDLVPVAKFAEGPFVIIANPQLPARSMKELIAYAKANPGKARTANPGQGSLGHLIPFLIEGSTGARFTNVAYSTGQRLVDLLSGEVDMTIDVPTALYAGHFATGKLVPLAMMSKTRFEGMPNIPTTVEGGFPDLVAEAWFGILAPRDTPRDIVQKLNQVLNEYLSSAEGKSQMLQAGLVATTGSPDHFQQYLKAEFDKWAPIIRKANISMD